MAINLNKDDENLEQEKRLNEEKTEYLEEDYDDEYEVEYEYDEQEYENQYVEQPVKKGLSVGAIVGIVIASVFLLGFFGLMALGFLIGAMEDEMYYDGDLGVTLEEFKKNFNQIASEDGSKLRIEEVEIEDDSIYICLSEENYGENCILSDLVKDDKLDHIYFTGKEIESEADYKEQYKIMLYLMQATDSSISEQQANELLESTEISFDKMLKLGENEYVDVTKELNHSYGVSYNGNKTLDLSIYPVYEYEDYEE